MAKFYGEIGFAIPTETSPDVWEDVITKRNYYGDILRNSRHLRNLSKLNDDIEISNQLSILADPFANENFHSIRYVEYMGTKWKVSYVEVQYPRLILSFGGVYNA